MDDKQLLEMAAKAAGIEYDEPASRPHPKSGAFWGLWLVFHDEPSEYDRRYWNPLTDDGDAMRLAMKLRLSIIQQEEYIEFQSIETVEVIGPPRQDGSLHCEMHSLDDDPMTVVRLCIVRAAASIGKGGVSTPKKLDGAREGNSCCEWLTFKEGFEEHWPRWFDAPPTPEHWASAVRDWKAGNTGFEAAHNAQRRAKERVIEANQKPLVHLGGRNYAPAGSELARRYGKEP